MEFTWIINVSGHAIYFKTDRYPKSLVSVWISSDWQKKHRSNTKMMASPSPMEKEETLNWYSTCCCCWCWTRAFLW